MHISEADARRREGETSWEVYGREAAAAEGRRRLPLLGHRRDAEGRLKSLEGLRLGDLRELLSETTLGQLELTLMLERTGKISPAQARADIVKLLRERPRSPRLRQYDMVAGFRESLHAQIGIGLHGYPLMEAFLKAFREQAGEVDRSSGREHPVREAVLEESFLDSFFGH
jgi:hypothetical protein